MEMNRLSRYLMVTTLCAAAAGCAGFRGGWESIPYIGDKPPAAIPEPETAQQVIQMSELNLPGVKLNVKIDNRLRTYDTQVYLFALPLVIDPRNVYTQNHNPGKTRVFVTTTAASNGFVFRPSLAVLEIADKRYTAVRGFRFGQWNAEGHLVEKDGKYEHREVGAEFSLSATRTHYLSLEFDVPVPSPESRDIRLDLSGALRDPALPPLPAIRFTPMRWKEGYT